MNTPPSTLKSETAEAAKRFVLPETLILTLICSIDLFVTIYLVATHQAIEANPLMAATLNNYGPTAFIIAKVLLMALPLTIAELARTHHPHFVKRALQVCIAVYLGIYILSFLKWNFWVLAKAAG
jgi:hypothetical protein